MRRARQIALGAAAVGFVAVFVLAATRSAAERTAPSPEPDSATAEEAPTRVANDTNDFASEVVDTPESSPPTRVTDPAFAEMLEVFARLDERVSPGLEPPPGWRPPAPTVASAKPTLPPQPAGRQPAAQLADVTRWFKALPAAEPKSEAELDASRRRMGKAGLELLESECRSGVCHLAFVYSERSSERLKARLNGRDTARGRASSRSFTILRSDGRVEGHIFLVGGASHGGRR